MKKQILLIALILLFGSLFSSFAVFSGLVVAQDGDAGVPQYNFGSMQPSKNLAGKPGQTIETRLYFYNIYGNRPTHIKLEIVDKPENWDVEIVPSARDVDYEVAGVIQTVQENLVVYPSEVKEKAGKDSKDKEWIKSKVGYVESDFVDVRISIPENEKIGVTKNIKINGKAFWLGQGGNIALEQERDFEYAVKTTTEYYEKPVNRITGFFTFEAVTANPLVSVLVGLVLIVVIVMIVVIIILSRKLNKQENRKRGQDGKNKK